MTPIIDAVRSVATRALDAALPANCLGCGVEGAPICPRCEPALDARLTRPAGVPIGLPGELPEPLLQLEWCASFHGVTRDALHAIKYSGEQRLAEPLGRAVARRWAAVGVGATLVTNVPVHADRAKQRGYDQAELIGRVAARSPRPAVRPVASSSPRDDRPIRPRPARSRAERPRRLCPEARLGAARSRLVGPARRRRRHDRLHPGGLRGGPRGQPAPSGSQR